MKMTQTEIILVFLWPFGFWKYYFLCRPRFVVVFFSCSYFCCLWSICSYFGCSISVVLHKSAQLNSKILESWSWHIQMHHTFWCNLWLQHSVLTHVCRKKTTNLPLLISNIKNQILTSIIFSTSITTQESLFVTHSPPQLEEQLRLTWIVMENTYVDTDKTHRTDQSTKLNPHDTKQAQTTFNNDMLIPNNLLNNDASCTLNQSKFSFFDNTALLLVKHDVHISDSRRHSIMDPLQHKQVMTTRDSTLTTFLIPWVTVVQHLQHGELRVFQVFRLRANCTCVV